MAHLPFPLAVNRRVLRAVLPAISLSMVLSVPICASSRVRFARSLVSVATRSSACGRIGGRFRVLGCWTHAGIARHAGPGQRIHYAGTLPHAGRPDRYQLHPDGRLGGDALCLRFTALRRKPVRACGARPHTGIRTTHAADVDSTPSTAGSVIELGSGSSRPKQKRPSILTSDVTPGAVDLLADGTHCHSAMAVFAQSC